MDAPLNRRDHTGERWTEHLPGAYLTRIAQPVRFVAAPQFRDSVMHLTGLDTRGEECYCHFHCTFSCPRCFTSRRPHRGRRRFLVTAREVWGWRLNNGRWFVYIRDTVDGDAQPRPRYLTHDAMPQSVCFEDDDDDND